MFKVPEKYRLKVHPIPFLSSSSADGNNGVFLIPFTKKLYLSCQASDGFNWEHVSVSVKLKSLTHYKPVKRCPTWAEICFIKSLFWSEEDTVIQYHPAKEDYVNMHEYTLHLWRPTEKELPKPNPLMVGINPDK